MLSLAAMRAWRLARVTMLIQYLYRDEVALSRFQSGLVFADDHPKPSLQASGCRSPRWAGTATRRRVGADPGGRPGRKPYLLEALHRTLGRRSATCG